MTTSRTAGRWRTAVAGVFIAASAFSVAACGEDVVDDVEQNVEEGVNDVEQEVEEGVDDAEQEVEEETDGEGGDG